MEYATDIRYEQLYEAINLSRESAKTLVAQDNSVLSATNSIGETVIDHFAKLNDVQKVTLLGDLGAEPSGITLRDITERGQLEITDLLLKYGADPRIMDSPSCWMFDPPSQEIVNKLCNIYAKYDFTLKKERFIRQEPDWDNGLE